MKVLKVISLSLALHCSVAISQPFEDIVDSTYEGYIYQGYSKSFHNNYYGPSSSEGGSPLMRDIGLKFNCALNDYLDFRAFLKLEQRGDRLDGMKPVISYLLLDAHKDVTPGNTIGIRAGKVRNEVGFFNGTMKDPVFRDMDVLPQSIYVTTLEDLINSSNGVQLYYHTVGLPMVNLTFGYSKVSPTFEPRVDVFSGWFYYTPYGVFNSGGRPSESYNFLATTKDLKWMFRVDSMNVYANYVPSSDDYFTNMDLSFRTRLIGIRRYFKNWDVSYEYSNTISIGDGFGLITVNNGFEAEAHSVVVRYVQDEKWTYLVGYNEWYSDVTDRSGEKLSSLYGVLPESGYYKDFNVGFKYKYDSNWTFKGSYHDIQGIVGLSPIENPDWSTTGKASAKLITMSVTYSF